MDFLANPIQPVACLPCMLIQWLCESHTATKQVADRCEGDIVVEWWFSTTQIKIKVTKTTAHNLTEYC